MSDKNMFSVAIVPYAVPPYAIDIFTTWDKLYGII